MKNSESLSMQTLVSRYVSHAADEAQRMGVLRSDLFRRLVHGKDFG